MIEYINIGCSPYGEKCAQVGEDNYYQRAKIECAAYRNQLYRLIESRWNKNRNQLPESFRLRVKGYPHDFGTYYEVEAGYNESDDEAIELASWLEENCPEYWDDIAKKEMEEDNKL